MVSSAERFEQLYLATERKVRAYCLRRLPAAEADDAAAEVFAVAWRKIEAVPADTNEALRWLYRTARYCVANSLRSARRRFRLAQKANQQPPMLAPPSDVAVVRQEEDRMLLEAVAALKPIDRELLELAAWEELGYEDIGAIVGLRPNTVAQRIHRALRSIGRQLEEFDHE